ncbi:MAG TPA: TIGR03086 family metal-binding protein [Trebonia sp.]
MTDSPDTIIDRFLFASCEFGRRLEAIQPGQWEWSTPCTEWDIRQLVNHMTRGNLSYVHLLHGGTSAEFVRLRDANALGADPVASYVKSVQDCAGAFARPGALERILDYPLGKVPGRQALAVRTADTVIHTWDLARAAGLDENLSASLVAWIDDHLGEIYAGLAETPIAAETTHRFFAAPEPAAASSGSRQDRLLHRMGRNP